MSPSLWMEINCLMATEPLQGDSFFFTNKLSGFPSTHLMYLRRRKDLGVELGATQCNQFSFHGTCHHQIIFSIFNLMTEYPPLYERLVWDYKKTNIDSIQKALGQTDWKFLFSYKSVNQQVKILNNTSMFFPKKKIKN